jgi:hypothetical protein
VLADWKREGDYFLRELKAQRRFQPSFAVSIHVALKIKEVREIGNPLEDLFT